MGRNKALLDFGGETLIERLYGILKSAFEEVLISANDPETYEFLGARVVQDVLAPEAHWPASMPPSCIRGGRAAFSSHATCPSSTST